MEIDRRSLASSRSENTPLPRTSMSGSFHEPGPCARMKLSQGPGGSVRCYWNWLLQPGREQRILVHLSQNCSPL